MRLLCDLCKASRFQVEQGLGDDLAGDSEWRRANRAALLAPFLYKLFRNQEHVGAAVVAAARDKAVPTDKGYGLCFRARS